MSTTRTAGRPSARGLFAAWLQVDDDPVLLCGPDNCSCPEPGASGAGGIGPRSPVTV